MHVNIHITCIYKNQAQICIHIYFSTCIFEYICICVYTYIYIYLGACMCMYEGEEQLGGTVFGALYLESRRPGLKSGLRYLLAV